MALVVDSDDDSCDSELQRDMPGLADVFRRLTRDFLPGDDDSLLSRAEDEISHSEMSLSPKLPSLTFVRHFRRMIGPRFHEDRGVSGQVSGQNRTPVRWPPATLSRNRQIVI